MQITSIVSFTSPTDSQCFNDPIEFNDDDSDVSRPIPNDKPDAKEKTAQEHDGTSSLFEDESMKAETEVPLMYRTDITGPGTLSLVDERWNERDNGTEILTELLDLMKHNARFRAHLTEILVYLGRDLTPSWMVDNNQPTHDEYTGWVRTLKTAASKIGIDLDENWILACITIGQDPKIFPDSASPCKCKQCWSPGCKTANTRSRFVVPTSVLKYHSGSESSSESKESENSHDSYADMPAHEQVQVRREPPQARWSDNDDSSDSDSDGSIPPLVRRDDTSSDDSSVGSASISSHESDDQDRLWDME
jgi:hypothetical protein